MTSPASGSPPREHAVLAVWDTRRDEPAGAGFLIAPDVALTCAHVVKDAIGAEPAVGRVVKLVLPLPGAQPGSHDESVDAVVEYWEPDKERDIAVLRLSAPTFGGVPTQLVEAADVNGHSMVTFGFPRNYDDGVWHEGRLLRRQGTGWIQAQLSDPLGHRIEAGFSGAPVWDEELDGAVGMVVGADRTKPTGYVLPTDTLLDVLPGLRAEVSYWRSAQAEPRVRRVCPPRPSWWNHIEPDAPTTFLPRARPPVWLLLVGVPWLLFWVAAFLASVLAGPSDTAEVLFNVAVFVMIGALAVPRQWRARLPRGLFAVAIVFNVLVAAAVMYSGVTMRSPDVAEVALLAVLAVQAGGIAVGLLAGRWLGRRQLDSVLPDGEVLAQRVFGRAGEARAVEPNPENERQARHKQSAQRASAELLVELLHIPAVRLLHAPAAPDQQPQRIDHVAVAGHRVAFIYSALWPPGHYTNAGPDGLSISRNGTGFPVAFPNDHRHFVAQVSAWQRRLPDVEVHAFLVVHASPPGPVTLELSNYPGTVLLAEQAVEVIGAWLVAESGIVDRRVFGQLLGNP